MDGVHRSLERPVRRSWMKVWISVSTARIRGMSDNIAGATKRRGRSRTICPGRTGTRRSDGGTASSKPASGKKAMSCVFLRSPTRCLELSQTFQ